MPDDRRNLDQPVRRRNALRPNVDSERFGALSESVARHIGSWAFILWMTIAIIIWIALNTLVPESARIDGFPFIFLTLLLSLQASYAAPLILLAQNRQADRDRVQFSVHLNPNTSTVSSRVRSPTFVWVSATSPHATTYVASCANSWRP